MEFNLDILLEGVADVFSTKIEEKKIEFFIDKSEDVPNYLLGDPVRLNQILTNLAGNAVKFTEKGQIMVAMRTLEKTPETINLEFSVKDTGIGLTANQIDKLFKPFSQADTSTTRKFGGTGLGLTIVKKLVLLMDGDIKVESLPEQGTIFTFNVKLKPLIQKAPPKHIQSSLKDLRILVIDDSPFMRDILLAMLKSLKIEADATSNFTDGLKILEEASTNHPYDLVIIDNNLPDATGAKVCAQIKAVNPGLDTKTILISGFREEEIVKEIEAVDFDSFLHKPFTLSSLHNMIQHVFGTEGANKKVTIASKELAVENLASIQGARILLVDDNKINQQIGCELLRASGLAVRVAENGQEALDSVKQCEFEAVLMDIQMPVMDGYRATREIRALPQFKDLPIIAMTANANSSDRKKALECGMNEHIPKPIDPVNLIKTLVHFISAKPGFIPLATTPGPALKSPQKKEIENPRTLLPIPGLDLEGALARVAHNEDFYKELLIRFSKDKADILEVYERTVDQKDVEKAARLLHSLKGVAANLGAMELTDKISQLEKKLRDNDIGAEHQTIHNSAKQSMGLLLEGIALLQQKYSKESETEFSQSLPEYSTLAPFLDELKELVSENNFKSGDYIKTIEKTFKESPFKDFLLPVKEHLNRFDFLQAAKSLEELKNNMETTLEKK